jgi:uncharacterized protein (TIRG00374 family)
VRRLAPLALRLLVSAVLIGWLLWRVDVGAMAGRFRSVGADTVGVVLGLQLVNTALKSYKWQQLLAADRIHLSHRAAFTSYMVGTFFSVFLPTAIGGDAVRAVDVARRSGRRAATATSVVADRVLGFAAIGVVGLAALALGAASALDGRLRGLGVGLYLAVLAASGVAFTDWLRRAAEWIPVRREGRLRQVLQAIATSVAAYRRSGGLLRWAAVSVVAQVIVIVAIWRIARALAIDVAPSYFFAIVPLVSLVESLPVSIFGLGTRDVSYVYLLGLVGVGREAALSVSLLYVALSLGYALIGGVLFALRGPMHVAVEDSR